MPGYTTIVFENRAKAFSKIRSIEVLRKLSASHRGLELSGRSHGRNLLTHGFDRLNESGHIGGLHSEGEESEPNVNFRHTETEQHPLLKQDLDGFGTVDVGIQGQGAKSQVGTMEFGTELGQILFIDCNPLGTQGLSDFGRISALAFQKLKIFLFEKSPHGRESH